MKRKIAIILVSMPVLMGSVFTVGASMSMEKQRSVTQSNSSQQGGTTLITETGNTRVIEVDSTGTIVWQKTGLNFPIDAERLANGNTLITESIINQVIEVDSGGTIVWQKAGLNFPYDAERLANGNTLIIEVGNNRVIEVDTGGNIVWEKTGLNSPIDAERLANGNTLITESFYGNRVIEVDSSGTIVWQKTGLTLPYDAERLANGNTLITDYGVNQVIEVDSTGTIVWQKTGLVGPGDAERLANGNTLIAEPGKNRVIEVDTGGNIVWEKAGLYLPWDVEGIPNEPPDAPIINGQTSGKTGVEYEYTFNTTDPEGDPIMYLIDWGDNNTEWTEYSDSGEEITLKHTWNEEGEYTIKAKAKDIHGAEGPEGTLTVTMPRNKPINFNLLELLFERFPNAFPILRHLLGI